MATGFDPSEMMEIFLAEAEEQLTAMDQALVELERQGDNRQAIDALFRAAHTLKASAAAQGLEQMAEISHKMEDVMDKVRAGELSATADLVDTLLACVDVLRQMLAAATGDAAEMPGADEIVGQLDVFLSGAQDASAASDSEKPNSLQESESVEEGDDGSQSESGRWRIALTPAAECLMPAARAWLWLQKLSKLGRVLLTVPGEEQLKQGDLSTGKLVVVLETTRPPQELREVAHGLPEVAEVEVTRPRQADIEQIEGDNQKAAQAGQRMATVRVKVAHLDALMRLVGELVMCRARLMREIHAIGDRVPGMSELRSSAEQLSAIVSELREEITKARLVPLEYTFSRFTRIVRDAARREGKEVELVIEGGETEVDRTVAEYIVDPLKHLLRNAVSHGIEAPEERERFGKPRKGKVTLHAQHLEGNILITVSDDGRGIDYEAIRRKAVERGLISKEQAAAMSERELGGLLFVPGFSTAEKVSDISGRGVGLDVVKRMIEEINGRIEMTSQPGEGTTFSLTLPLTLAIMPALIVCNGGLLYGLPLSSVERIVRVSAEETTCVDGRLAFNHLGYVLEIVELSEVVGDQPSRRDVFNVLVVRAAQGTVGLAVDEVVGEQEIVIKPLPHSLTQCQAISGLATIGEGEFVLLIDPNCLAASGRSDPARRAERTAGPEASRDG